MAFFPGITGGDFTPLFRLLDDYDSHRSSGGRRSGIQSFQPKFDVREVKDAYELHGELPGIDQKNVIIEFADPTTLVIKGRVEREYVSGSPPGPEDTPSSGRITAAEDDHSNSHKATVEDEAADGKQGSSSQTQAQGQQDGNQQVSQKQHGQHHQHHQNKSKFWVAERSVGEFHRSFSFPNRVDQDNVKASLKNGILSVTIPKAPAHQSKKINIE